MLTAEQIREKATAGPQLHVVRVASWGGEKVVLQELDGLQAHEFDKGCLDRSKDDRVAMDYGTTAEHLVRLSLVSCEFDENGLPIRGTQKRVFGDTRPDIQAIRGLGAALSELYMKSLKVSRMRKIDEEETEKNSEPVPSSDSGSTSQTDGAAA